MGKIILNNIEYGTGTPNSSNVDTTNLVKKDNIVTVIDENVTDEQIPSALATYTKLEEKVDKDAIVTNLSGTLTDEQIPSAKVTFDKLEEKVDTSKIVTELDGHSSDEEIPSVLLMCNELDKKVSLDSITDVIDETSTDTQLPHAKIVYDKLEEKVNKTSIVTTLDDTVTDEQVASALSIYNKLEEVFQSSNDAQDEYETAIIGKGGTVSKVGDVATKSEILDGIDSISVGEDITPIHDTITDLGCPITNLSGLDGELTANVINEWFVLKPYTTENNVILDSANDLIGDWLIDGELIDFGDYINPNYSATQLTVIEDVTTGLFISEELDVHELYAIDEGSVN